MGRKKTEEAGAIGDVDRHRGLHTQACFDYARQTMKDVGIAHCIVQCADERSARLAAGASKVSSRAAAGINKERERALDTLTGFGVPGAHALEVLNIFEGAIVNELAQLEVRVPDDLLAPHDGGSSMRPHTLEGWWQVWSGGVCIALLTPKDVEPVRRSPLPSGGTST